jgi:hypothetical protein
MVQAQVRRIVKRHTPRKPVVLAVVRWHDENLQED